jgi:hypothetical protein
MKMVLERRMNPKVQEILTTANPLTVFNLLKMATHFTIVEGGEWYPTKGGDAPVSSHAIRFGNEAEWDCVSGFRDLWISVEVPGQVEESMPFGQQVGLSPLLTNLSPSQHMFDTSEAPPIQLPVHDSELDAQDLHEEKMHAMDTLEEGVSDSVDESSSESEPR